MAVLSRRRRGFQEKSFTAAFIFVAAMYACLAAELTGPLCKLQREERASVCSPPTLVEVVRKEGRKN